MSLGLDGFTEKSRIAILKSGFFVSRMQVLVSYSSVWASAPGSVPTCSMASSPLGCLLARSG